MIDSGQTAIGRAMRTGLAETVAATASRKTVVDRLSIAFFTAIFMIVSLYTLARPDYNWDLLAYVATALEDRYDDPIALHAEAWREIEARADAGALYHLRYDNPYNKHQWENPADFKSQLSMYRVKVAYIALMRGLEPIAGSFVTASLWLSVVPAIGLGLLCLHWLRREGAVQGAIVLGPLLVIAGYAHMTTAVTPDILLSLISLVAVYLLLKGRDAAAGVMLFASVFVRPDNIVMIFALLITAVAFGWRSLPLLVTFVASLVACVLISKYSGHPGWWPHFYFSCVGIQNSMAGFQPDFSLVDLARGYVRGVTISLLHHDWPAIFALLIAGWALLHRAGRTGSGRENALMFALAIGTLGKFASFPLSDDRFYFAFIAGMAILVVTMWKPRFDIAVGSRKAGYAT